MAPPTKRQRLSQPRVSENLNDGMMAIDPRLLDSRLPDSRLPDLSLTAPTSFQSAVPRAAESSTTQAAEPSAPQATQPSAPPLARGGLVKVRTPGSGKEKLDEVVRSGMIEEEDELRFSMEYGVGGKIDASIIVCLLILRSSTILQTVFAKIIVQVTDITPSCLLNVAITSTVSQTVSLPATDAAPGQATSQPPPVTLQRLHYEVRGPSALQIVIFEAHGIQAVIPKRFPVWKRFQVYRNGQDIGSLWDLRETLGELRAKGDQATFDRILASRRHRGPPKMKSSGQRVARGLELISQGMNAMQEERDEAVTIAAELYKFVAEIAGNLSYDATFRPYYNQRIFHIASRSKKGIWAEVTGATEGEGENNPDEDAGDGEEREEE